MPELNNEIMTTRFFSFFTKSIICCFHFFSYYYNNNYCCWLVLFVVSHSKRYFLEAFWVLVQFSVFLSMVFVVVYIIFICSFVIIVVGCCCCYCWLSMSMVFVVGLYYFDILGVQQKFILPPPPLSIFGIIHCLYLVAAFGVSEPLRLLTIHNTKCKLWKKKKQQTKRQLGWQQLQQYLKERNEGRQFRHRWVFWQCSVAPHSIFSCVLFFILFFWSFIIAAAGGNQPS